ncbi:MAG TPA: tripartite tricarboxylate transporter substrate binding protein [Burkholderiales bacterium]|nr:tripartite tricarboxylate transporter substrate binding protein [Burkholderiales bacterium]
MKMTRFLPVALVFAAGLAVAQAPAYPVKSVRLLVPSSPGGGTDILARVLAQKMSETFGQQVVVENRPGAGQVIGIEAVARSAPDGYTLLMAASAIVINEVLYAKPPYDTLRDFAPVTLGASLPNILVVHPALPVKSVRELIVLAKTRAGQLNYSSAGSGTSPHLSMELFRLMAGITLTHIPYKGSGPATVDLLAGQVQLSMPNVLTALPHIKGGKLRGLSVTSGKRATGLPDIPAIAETLPGYEAIQWYGILAPAGTSRDIVGKLQAEIARILVLPEVKDRLAADGADAVGSRPDEFAAYIRAELAKWGKVVKTGGIKLE